MVSPLSGWLTFMAEMSNLASFYLVIGGFAVMFIFILRRFGQDFQDVNSGVNRVTHSPPQIGMCKVSVPFSFSLKDNSSSSYSSLSVTTSSTTPYLTRCYWGVSVPNLHHVLRAPSPWFHQAFVHGNLFGRSHCQQMGELETHEAHEEREVVVKKPTEDPLNLGLAPREVYPLVVCFVKAGSDCDEGTPDSPDGRDDVTTLVSVVHLRDEQCQVPSQVLASYLKHASGRVTALRQLYITSAGESEDTESAEDSDTESDRLERISARCVVCQVERISRAVLPCRHATTCGNCFNRLQNRCPMCRGFIQSYFLLQPERAPPPQPPAPRQENSTWMQMLNGWNERLNQAMGFQQN